MRKAIVLIATIAFGVVTAAQAANAFNPQPEPPAHRAGKVEKSKTGLDNDKHKQHTKGIAWGGPAKRK